MGHRNGGPKKGTKYPHRWVTGPDPLRHEQYQVWLQQRNQANFRGEGWDLPFDDWLTLWGDKWSLRGRQKDDYCMTRKNASLAWDTTNAIIVTRQEHMANHRQRNYELGKTRGYRRRLLDEQQKTGEGSKSLE